MVRGPGWTGRDAQPPGLSRLSCGGFSGGGVRRHSSLAGTQSRKGVSPCSPGGPWAGRKGTIC